MISKSFRNLLTAGIFAICATVGLSNADAQMFSDADIVAPMTMTFGVGGGLNTNMAHGNYDPGQTGSSLAKSGNYAAPSFHAEAEFPLASRLRIAPRVTYNDYSAVLDDNGNGVTVDASQFTAFAYKTVGVDLLLKYSVMNGLHAILGGNASESIKRSYAIGADNVEAASTSTKEMPNSPEIMGTILGGLGYDIPLSSTERIWITPEVTYAVPLVDLAQGTNDGDLRVNTLSSKITLKMGLGQ